MRNKITHLIRKATDLRLLFFLVVVTSPVIAQGWQPTFQLGLNAEAAGWGEDVSLSKYLSKNADLDAGDHGCYLKISLFYFRVNGLGAVDSIYAMGSLNIDPGRSKSCFGQQGASRTALEELLSLYSMSEPTKDPQGRVMLPPNELITFSEK